MVVISPQQEIFTKVRGICSSLGYTVYDYLPTDGVAYPFVFIGEQSDQDEANKTAVFGYVQQTIHVYHNDYKKRGTTTTIIDNIKREIRKINRTDNFDWSVEGITGQVLSDNTTVNPLLHGVIDVEFYFN